MTPGSPSGSGSRPQLRRRGPISVNPHLGIERTGAASAPMTERFEVDALVGEGGMGRVVAAQDRGLGRVVAIKELRDELMHDVGSVRRFVVEAQITAQLEHPNIVPVYSLERSPEGRPAFAMRLVEGVTLGAYIREATAATVLQRTRLGPFALKQRVGMLIAACDAIHFAHARRVIHRDLKPDNVMLGPHHEVYVMDWGLARVTREPGGWQPREAPSPDSAPPTRTPEERELIGSLPTIRLGRAARDDAAGAGDQEREAPSSDAGSSVRDDETTTRRIERGLEFWLSPTMTRDGDLMGTPQYMAPEQAQARWLEVGPAADQFSLGVMLLELATLLPARSHSSARDALAAAGEGVLAPPIDIDGAPLPPALAAIVARATRHEASARYASVELMAEDLRRFIRDEPVSVYREGVARRLVRAAAQRPGWAVALVAAVVLLALLTAMANVVERATRDAERAREESGTRRLLLAATGRAQVVDVHLSDLAAGVHGIGAASIELLDLGPALKADAPLRPAPPTLELLPTHAGAPVSFEVPLVTWPGRDEGATAPPSAQRIESLERWLRQVLLDAVPPDVGSGAEAKRVALAAGKSSLLRAFVAMEDGTFTELPYRKLDRQFDARQRSWYRAATKLPRLEWTRPVTDGNTLCIQALLPLRSGGRLLGVAGSDLRVEVLARELSIPLAGFRRAYLVMPDGKIAVASGLEAEVLKHAADAAEPSAVELPTAAHPRIVAAARDQDGESGGVFEGPSGELVAFARLVSPPWVYVVEVDGKTYRAH